MKRTKRALPPFVSEDVALATGQVRLYFRRPGQKKIRIWPSVEQEGFWPAYEAAKGGTQLPKPQAAPKKRQSGVRTFEMICQDYYRSADFEQLTTITQRTRRGILKHCCDDETKAGSGLRMGDTPIYEFGPNHVSALRDRKATLPEAANNRVKAIRGVFTWYLRGKPGITNPCSAFEKLRSKNPDGFHSWTLAEAAKFEARHPLGTTARLAFDLALYTAQRRSDVVRLGPHSVSTLDGAAWLSIGQKKTNAKIEIPIVEPLALSIAARPNTKGPTFLVTTFDKPFTSNGIGNAFRAWCDEAGLAHCSMHGLRKATASRLAELGVDELGIGSVTGHAPGSKTLTVYTKAARRRLMASNAMSKLQASLSTSKNEADPGHKLSHQKSEEA